MTEEKPKTYRVEIFEYKTGEVEAVIGRGLNERQAEKREMTGLMRCNKDYGCRTIEE